MPLDRPIALIGLMGSGKTVVAPRLAARLGVRAVDLDTEIAAAAGRTIAQIFADEGEVGFRRRETDQLRAILERTGTVVACGGGVVLDARHREWLRTRCRVVWLEVDPAEAARRLGASDDRPKLQNGSAEARLRTLLAEREALYAEIAELRVATGGRTPGEVAAAVEEGLGLDREGR